MSLFQTSVLKKHIKGLDKSAVDEAWGRYFNHFHDKAIQLNIRNSKEEQYQEGFLRDLFVSVFGYVLNPATDFNLTTELKNVKGAKKTDGAILKDDKALAVIELKGTNTTDLAKVESQAFGYKNNQPGCVYVITSNFEKLRFYIDNAVDFEEFNLFQLTRERFEVLWLCLSSEYLLKNIPKQIKDESLTQEENITKKLYKDYSLFRNEIFDSIQRNNSDFDKLTLFKKTQKLLDRFLFIFFAEDRLLLPPNSIREIINQWTDLRDKYDEYQPLYSRFKKYFGYVNTGYKGKKHDIFAYNGGLFEPDEILDNIKIDDDLLYKHTQNLSNYDFESEVSVNILGHIFEHSLNEIEEIQAELEGIETDKSKSKRKKDGVFYTPKYITKYIVDNTVGKLCEEKKTALEIDEAEYEKDRKGRKKATLKALLQKLEDYRYWLLELTICDPACGSGAFLNQALEFLINEHRYIDELNAKLLGEAMILSEVENSILENNLFGVDINEESVEIAKLSLWLRTAQKGRKLTSLNNNIKCGNSLIDEPEVAGDKAFNWREEFPKVFKDSGFDVVIGNPPYVSFQNIHPNLKDNFNHTYRSSKGKYDLYVLFLERGLSLLKTNGYLSYIMPNKFLVSNYGEGIKDVLLQKQIVEIIDFKDMPIFEDATTYPCIITVLQSTKTKSFVYREVKEISGTDFKGNELVVTQKDLNNQSWAFGEKEKVLLLEKITQEFNPLKNYSDSITQGLRTGKLDVFFNAINTQTVQDLSIENELVRKIYHGKNVKRYLSLLSGEEDLLIFPYKTDNSTPVEIASYPFISKYLESSKEDLSKRKDSGKFFHQTSKMWFEFWDSKPIVFESPKIIFPDISINCNFLLEENGYGYLNTCYGLFLKEPYKEYYKVVLAILNSNVNKFYMSMISPTVRGGFYRFKTKFVEQLPMPDLLAIEFSSFNNIVDEIIDLRKVQLAIVNKFIRTFIRKFSIDKTSKKLLSWHKLTFAEFVNELKKQKVKLSLSDEVEWEDYFEAEKEKKQAILSQIEKADKKINQMVYELYGLTEEETKIVEESIV
jgi:type I restriction-modification system DNA methylase subunit